jgi:hypothetical protein
MSEVSTTYKTNFSNFLNSGFKEPEQRHAMALKIADRAIEEGDEEVEFLHPGRTLLVARWGDSEDALREFAYDRFAFWDQLRKSQGQSVVVFGQGKRADILNDQPWLDEGTPVKMYVGRLAAAEVEIDHARQGVRMPGEGRLTTFLLAKAAITLNDAQTVTAEFGKGVTVEPATEGSGAARVSVYKSVTPIGVDLDTYQRGRRVRQGDVAFGNSTASNLISGLVGKFPSFMMNEFMLREEGVLAKDKPLPDLNRLFGEAADIAAPVEFPDEVPVA